MKINVTLPSRWLDGVRPSAKYPILKTLIGVFAFAVFSATRSFAFSYSDTQPGGSLPYYWASNTTLDVNFAVPQIDGALSSISISLDNVSYPNMAVTKLTLIAPGGGTWFDVYDGVGSGTSTGTYTFSDNPGDPQFSNSASPSGGSYRPQGGSFLGTFSQPGYAAGTWTARLTLWDNGAGYSVGSATLNLTAVPEMSSAELMGVAFAGGLFWSTLRRRFVRS